MSNDDLLPAHTKTVHGKSTLKWPELSWRRTVRLIWAAVAAVAATTVLGQNYERVTLHFLFWEWSMRIGWVILACIGGGGLLEFVLSWLRRRSVPVES